MLYILTQNNKSDKLKRDYSVSSFSSNDFTLNSLLTLLPKKVYIHMIDCYIDEFITTLQSIFENKVTICEDCSICNLYKLSKENINLKNPNTF